MENTPVQPTTKDAALSLLGVASKKTRAHIAPQVEFVHVAAGRRLLKKGAFMPSVLVGVSGTVTLVDSEGTATTLEAPCVVDLWAADQRRVAQVDVTAESPTSLVLVDWSARDVVFTAAPKLRRLARTCRAHVLEPAATDAVEPVDDTHPTTMPVSI